MDLGQNLDKDFDKMIAKRNSKNKYSAVNKAGYCIKNDAGRVDPDFEEYAVIVPDFAEFNRKRHIDPEFVEFTKNRGDPDFEDELKGKFDPDFEEFGAAKLYPDFIKFGNIKIDPDFVEFYNKGPKELFSLN